MALTGISIPDLPPPHRLAKWKPLPPTDPTPDRRIILALGDADTSFNVGGTPPSSMKGIIAALNNASKRMGVLTAQDTADRRLIGEKKLSYFKVPENKTSQIASCMFHPSHHQELLECEDIPLQPRQDHPARLLSVDSLYAVKQCQHCLTKWNRDVNAARNIRRNGLAMLNHVPKHPLFNRYTHQADPPLEPLDPPIDH